MAGDLSQIIKAYDVRGTVPDQLNVEVATAIGVAFAQLVAAEGATGCVLAHDMRASSPELVAAFANGVTSQGLDVIKAGLGSTDMLYFGSGSLGIPGAMFTASHNPAQYNGIKMCRAGAVPIGQDTGLAQIRTVAQRILDGEPARPAGKTGTISSQNLLADYAAQLRTLVDLRAIRPLKVVVDAGNGMAGHTVPAVFDGSIPVTIIPLYFELDGTFPNHEANPLDPRNLRDLQSAVVKNHADIGLAFDGDADRCFVVDESGAPVSPSTVTALVAVRELAKHPGGSIIHNLITSAAVPEIVAEHGGTPIRSRVGHSFIKAEMARSGAIFGGEHSAHYYFRDFYNADTGMLAALHVLAALGEQDGPLSSLVSEYDRYPSSGEINSVVADATQVTKAIAAAFPDAATDTVDGLTLRFTDGSWFNVRASNTEPLLRLNVEAATADRMAELRDHVLTLIRKDEK